MSHTAGIYYLYLWLLCNEQNAIDCTNILCLHSMFYKRLYHTILCYFHATSRILKIYIYSISYFGPTVCIRILINLLLCFILFIFNNFMANEKSSNTKTVLHYSTVLEECDYVTVRSENNSSHIWNSLWILMTFIFIQLEKETSLCKVCYELNLLELYLHWHFQI